VAETFSFLSPFNDFPEIRADFVARIPGVPTSTDKMETLKLLEPYHTAKAKALGFSQTHLAEQVHGHQVATVNADSPLMTLGVDGLITHDPSTCLGIHVADCGAVYFFDHKSKAIGLAHSGKKGSEENITGLTIQKMQDEFGSQPSDLIVILAPCIRPPHYELNFASMIREQALAAGVSPQHYHDCGLCTASDLGRFYSYRPEKGNTGRMIALLGLKAS